jgi:hypothetical protein
MTCDPCSLLCVSDSHRCDAGFDMYDLSSPNDLTGCMSPCGASCCTSGQQCMQTYCCTPGAPDLPDDQLLDGNCDGIDGTIADAVFVDPIGGSDANAGTIDHPKQHLGGASGAIATAAATGKHQVLVSKGAISEPQPVTLADGVGVWAGYDAAHGWQRADANGHASVMVSGGTTGVAAMGLSKPTAWDRVDVTGPGSTVPSASVYGFFVVSCGGALAITHATITAGHAGDGASAPAPPAAPMRFDGTAGGTSNVGFGCGCDSTTTANCQTPPGYPGGCTAGSGGTPTCGGYNGGSGADCGVAPNYEFGAVPSASNGDGPAGGAGASVSGPAQPGGPGASSAPAAGGASFGTVDNMGYHAADGATGADGQPGSGGGGGHLSPDPVDCSAWPSTPGFNTTAGGGGGGGGCAGKAAAKAGGGGGSFALFAWQSNLSIDRVTFVSGAGGAGGQGAAGQSGGAGGLGGGSGATLGASGGRGGDGAASGGGGGGPSFCIELAGGSQTPSGQITYQVGAPGPLGMGGVAGNNNGQPGASGATHNN